MATSKQDISGWFDHGILNKHDFMIIVCDKFDWQDYPVYCKRNEFNLKHKQYNGQNMQQVIEVYDLSLDKDSQLNQGKCMNLPKEECKLVVKEKMSVRTKDSIDLYVWCFVAREFATYVNKKEKQYNGEFDWSKFPQKMKERIPFKLAVAPLCLLSKNNKKKRQEQLEYSGQIAESAATELITAAGFVENKND